MEAVFGTWKNKIGSEENMPAFLTACKVPEAMQAPLAAREYEITYSKGDGDNKLKVLVKVTNDPKIQPKEYAFELGKEFECDDIDGQHLKGVVEWDGLRFVENYTDAAGNIMAVGRDFSGSGSGGSMKMTMKCNGVSATNEWVKC